MIGGQAGRADPIGSYRPELPPPAFAGPCDPLPSGVEIDFAHHLRADRMITDPAGREVRRLDLHFDLTDAATVRRALQVSLFEAGFVAAPAPPESDPDVLQWFARDDYGLVGVAAHDFAGAEDDVVRGAWLLDLPPSTLTPDVREACDNPVRSKRW